VFSLRGFEMQLVDTTKEANVSNMAHTIDVATEMNADELRELSCLINEHLASPPVFLKGNERPLSDQEIKKTFRADASNAPRAKSNAVLPVEGVPRAGVLPATYLRFQSMERT
jgi:hypothetical protein